MEGQGWCGFWPVAGGSYGDVTMTRTQGPEVVQPAGASEDKIREGWGYQAGFPGEVANRIWKEWGTRETMKAG